MIMNWIVIEWSGEVRSITYSADAKSVSVVYRVTLYGTDAEVYTFFMHCLSRFILYPVPESLLFRYF